MSASLCDNCDNLFRVDSEFGGRIVNKCTAERPHVDLTKAGEIKKCSRYAAKDLPWIIEKEAWLIKFDDDGKLYFKTSEGDKATIKKGVIGFTKMKEGLK